MKNKKTIVSLVLMIVMIILLISCDLLFNTEMRPKQNEEPVYTPDYAWQLKLDGMKIISQAYTEGKYFYLLEFIVEDIKNVRLVKIDMDTGKYVWKAPKVFSKEDVVFGFSSIIKINDILYYMTPRGFIYCHSDIDGSLKAVVQVGGTEKEMFANRCVNDIITYKNNIYWCSFRNRPEYNAHLFKLNTVDIDYNNKDELQIIIPESLYSEENWQNCKFRGVPMLDRDVLYLLTLNLDYWDNKGASNLVAIDLNTDSILWETRIEKLHGLTENTLLVKEDILYVVNSSLLKVNKHTGEILLRHNDEDGDVYTRPSLIPSPYVCGIQYHEGRLYYTTIMSRDAHLQVNISKDLVYSLVCVDANSLEFVWGFHPVGGTSSTFPIIKDGKAYIVTHIDGLRVFDIKTGELIGVDKSIIAWGDEKTFLYKNYYIFYNVDFKANRATLCAIKI